MKAPEIDAARWALLSSRLDELLDLDEPARRHRLAALRADDAALADELHGLLARMGRLAEQAFLEQPAMAHGPGSFAGAKLAGQRFGAYTLERELGQGGMGSVWLASRTDGRYEGRVAIKFLRSGLFAHGDAERFAREGSILARLDHPHIARLIDAGVGADGSQPYLVLDYIEGLPIDRHCEQQALGSAARVRLFLDVLAAVSHAHNRLILHRDLKPSNILVTPGGQAKLLDFGIAKLLGDDGEPAGASELTERAGQAYTLHYAAPEQVQGGEVTTATDVYALGVLLYRLLTGGHPTSAQAAARSTALSASADRDRDRREPDSEAANRLEQMRALIEREPRRLSDAVLRQGGDGAARRARELRGDLDTIVARALKKAPAERYANAADLADDLRRSLNHEPIAARPDSRAYVLGKFLRRHRVGVAAGATAALALAVGAGVALWEAREARRQQVQAEGLIEFMLGDLRKKLQPVGRLDVLDAVGAQALGYYAAQNAGRLDAASLGRQARALHLIGEIAEQRGQLGEAARVLRQAASSTALLMARAPNDGQRVFDHAQSEYWVGLVAWRRGEVSEAEQAFSRYQRLAQRLVQMQMAPEHAEWQAEPAFAAQNLGVVYLRTGRLREALATFEAGRAVLLRLVGQRPELRYELAISWGWTADARDALGDFEGAIQAQRAKLETLSQVPGAESDRNVQSLRANGQQLIGRMQMNMGRTEAAATTMRAALDPVTALSALDPSNLLWLAALVGLRIELAEAELALQHLPEADRQLAAARSEVQRLLAADRDGLSSQVYLRGRWLLLQVRASGVSARAADLAALQAYLSDALRFENAGKTFNEIQIRTVARAELALGDALAGSGAKGADAAAHWASCAQRLRAMAARGDPPAMALLAHAALRLGKVQEARALSDSLKASAYRHPVYADLIQRLSPVAGAAPGS